MHTRGYNWQQHRTIRNSEFNIICLSIVAISFNMMCDNAACTSVFLKKDNPCVLFSYTVYIKLTDSVMALYSFPGPHSCQNSR